jgi:2-polyprenyl-6-methoxyphenol hydroxylase-like FAD-dependent oxidoreductase
MNVEGRPSAVIVGGGIGGLTAGIALRRAGWSVTVCERAAGLEPVGAGLFVWPNAVRALRAVGLADALLARANVLDATGVRRPDGRWLSRLDGAAVERRHGEPLLAIARADLIAVLASALPAGALRLGVPVTTVHDGGAGEPALVRCGDETLTADLVVGADGIGSVVRTSTWPDQPPPTYRGYTAWRALVRAPAITTRHAGETWGRGERFGIVPLGGDRFYVYATANAPAGARAADEPAELRRRFGRWHDPIPALLARVERGTVLRHDVFAIEPPRGRMHHGRVALLGDAAHAMEPNLGQGACLAIEDAVVLAHALASAPPPGVAGLERYSDARTPRVTRLARRSRLLGRLTQTSATVLVAARDTATRLMPDGLAARGFDDAAGWRPPGPTAAVSPDHSPAP